jgi:hypothetical protein
MFVVGGYCTLECLSTIPVGGIVPLILLCCSAGNDLFQCQNRQSNRFFPRCVNFYRFINYVPKQLKNIISNANFTVEEGGHIIGERYEGRGSSGSSPAIFYFSENSSLADLRKILVVLWSDGTSQISPCQFLMSRPPQR